MRLERRAFEAMLQANSAESNQSGSSESPENIQASAGDQQDAKFNQYHDQTAPVKSADSESGRKDLQVPNAKVRLDDMDGNPSQAHVDANVVIRNNPIQNQKSSSDSETQGKDLQVRNAKVRLDDMDGNPSQAHVDAIVVIRNGPMQNQQSSSDNLIVNKLPRHNACVQGDSSPTNLNTGPSSAFPQSQGSNFQSSLDFTSQPSATDKNIAITEASQMQNLGISTDTQKDKDLSPPAQVNQMPNYNLGSPNLSVHSAASSSMNSPPFLPPCAYQKSATSTLPHATFSPTSQSTSASGFQQLSLPDHFNNISLPTDNQASSSGFISGQMLSGGNQFTPSPSLSNNQASGSQFLPDQNQGTSSMSNSSSYYRGAYGRLSTSPSSIAAGFQQHPSAGFLQSTPNSASFQAYQNNANFTPSPVNSSSGYQQQQQYPQNNMQQSTATSHLIQQRQQYQNTSMPHPNQMYTNYSPQSSPVFGYPAGQDQFKGKMRSSKRQKAALDGSYSLQQFMTPPQQMSQLQQQSPPMMPSPSMNMSQQPPAVSPLNQTPSAYDSGFEGSGLSSAGLPEFPRPLPHWVPLSVKMAALNARFYMVPGTERLRSHHEHQAAALERERVAALQRLSTQRWLSGEAVTEHFDRRHVALINQTDSAITALEKARNPALPLPPTPLVAVQAGASPDEGPMAHLIRSLAHPYRRRSAEPLPCNSRAVQLMQTWYRNHVKHPYPSLEVCQTIAEQGQCSVDQVKKWFSNKRQREGHTKTVTEIAQHRREAEPDDDSL